MSQIETFGKKLHKFYYTKPGLLCRLPLTSKRQVALRTRLNFVMTFLKRFPGHFFLFLVCQDGNAAAEDWMGETAHHTKL